MADKFLPIGKLPQEILGQLIRRIQIKDKSIVIPPNIGEDAAVIGFGDRNLVFKSDPITFTSKNIGYYSITVNSNDLFVMGAVPRWFLCTILLPEGKTDIKLADSVFTDVIKNCEREKIALCGGHTEVTPGIDRPIIIGFLMGEVKKANLINKRNIKAEDVILFAKGVGIESTSIIADIKKNEITKKYGKNFCTKCKNFLYNPGISVKRPVKYILGKVKISGMHDPTEGGLIGGILELSTLVKKGFEVDLSKVPIYRETEILCNYFNINPFKTISSGGLIIVAEKDEAKKIKTILNEHNIPCEIIGKFLGNEREKLFLLDGKAQRISPPVKDDISKVIK